MQTNVQREQLLKNNLHWPNYPDLWSFKLQINKLRETAEKFYLYQVSSQSQSHVFCFLNTYYPA